MQQDDSDNLPEITTEELRQRVVYALLRPATELAKGFRFSRRDILELVELSYFHRLREEDHILSDIADVLDISQRKTAQLSKQLKKNFMQSEVDYDLTWQIEFMLWAGPMTEGRLIQALADVSKQEARSVLDEMVEEERIYRENKTPPVYKVSRSEVRLYRNNWIARIHGLTNLGKNLVNTVWNRFFGEGEDSFARTVSFQVREEDVDRLEELYQQKIWETLKELDESAREDDSARTFDLSIIWAPSEEDEQ